MSNYIENESVRAWLKAVDALIIAAAKVICEIFRCPSTDFSKEFYASEVFINQDKSRISSSYASQYKSPTQIWSFIKELVMHISKES